MAIRIYRTKEGEGSRQRLRLVGIGLLGAAAALGLGIFVARDQMVRHRRDLFSPHPLRRLAALGYLRSHPQVENVMLLRDFLAWEERPLLRKKAAAILEELEEELALPGAAGEDPRGPAVRDASDRIEDGSLGGH